MIKEQKFLESIYRENEIEKVKVEDLKIEESYKGPLLEMDQAITADWVKIALEYMRG